MLYTRKDGVKLVHERFYIGSASHKPNFAPKSKSSEITVLHTWELPATACALLSCGRERNRWHGHPNSIYNRLIFLLELLLDSLIVPAHSISGEFLARYHGILLQRTLNFSVLAWLVEESDAIALAIVVIRLAWGLDAVERGLEAVVGP